LPLTLVPLDVTRHVVWRDAGIERLATAADPVARFAAALGRAGRSLGRARGADGIVLHDPLAVAVAADPTLATMESAPVEVETLGSLARGMTIMDRRPPPGRWRSGPACQVALAVDAARVLRLFEERLWAASA
jgi:purine nucleosidase